jgi:hypothetical protein
MTTCWYNIFERLKIITQLNYSRNILYCWTSYLTYLHQWFKNDIVISQTICPNQCNQFNIKLDDGGNNIDVTHIKIPFAICNNSTRNHNTK